jgi:flagellar biosynthesis regulator FlaF
LQTQQEKLLSLKRQQEEIERRKRELEELNRKRRELADGQKAMKERLTRAVAILENAEYDARKEIEQIQLTRQTFADHLATIEAIDPNKWPTETIDDQLTKSLSQIDHARAVYTQARVRIDALSGKDIDKDADDKTDESMEENAEAYGVSFGELLKRGLALSLPLIITLLIFAFIIAKKTA